MPLDWYAYVTGADKDIDTPNLKYGNGVEIGLVNEIRSNLNRQQEDMIIKR